MRKPKLTEEEIKERGRKNAKLRYERQKADPTYIALQSDPEYLARRRAMQNAAIARRKIKNAPVPAPAPLPKRNNDDPEAIRTRKAKKAEYDRLRSQRNKKQKQDYLSRPDVKERILAAKRSKYVKQRQDPSFVLLINIRARIGKIRKLFQLGRIPTGSEKRFLDYFGAEPEVVVAHIVSQLTSEMTWENLGEVWHIDHIIPISVGLENIELLTKLNHYKNLRPLLKAENLSKGNKMPDFFPDGVPFTPEEVGWLPPEARQPTVGVVQVAAGVSGAG